MHVVDDDELGNAPVCELLCLQRTRDDADRVSSLVHHRVRDHTHEPDIAAAVDESEAVPDDGFSEGVGISRVGGVRAGSTSLRAAVDADLGGFRHSVLSSHGQIKSGAQI